jgi:3',5'-cyclic AMP phosphodiesterase CpdA
VPTRILHVSDLHFGARNGLDDAVLEKAILELRKRVGPTLVVASGDLTHGGRADEHGAAADFLRSLDAPLLVIPGNHDIPPFSPARFTHPWREFERQWGTTEPLHSTPELHVVGLNSVRPFGYQRGRLGSADLERAETRLREAPAGALRVVAAHHQLTGAPWRPRKLPLAGRNGALERLAAAGAELIVGGHTHQAAICERREFEVLDGETRSCVLATAPGLGRPRAGRRFEVRGMLVYDANERRIRVETYIWRAGSWSLTARREFPRGPGTLQALV